MTNLTSRNQLVVPNAEAVIEQMKLEIANELGIELGAETTARENGRVGGEVTRRLIALGQQKLIEDGINNQFIPQSNNVHQDQLH